MTVQNMIDPDELVRFEVMLGEGQWLPRDVSQKIIAEVMRLMSTVQQQADWLREMTEERDALNRVGVKKPCACGHGVLRCTWCGAQPGAPAASQ